eukprot:GHRR01037474.1.p1 GENE.GHRR01037474.1~~GHRR01037474.1.p1  ORF type:complete len:135 (+),score=34.59 GHRR01037474.1:97-501(+)
MIMCCLQVRPNDNIRFKAITLEEAYTAIFKTDALIDAVTQLVKGKLTLQDAEQQLKSLTVAVPQMPATRPVLVRHEASADHPGLLIRLAGDRWVCCACKGSVLLWALFCGLVYLIAKPLITACLHAVWCTPFVH